MHHYSNAVFVLPDADVVVRITAAEGAARVVEASQAVIRHLIRDHGFPATAPLDDAPPVSLPSGLVAGFWRFYPQPDAERPFCAAHLARLLRDLHDVLAPPVELPAWRPLATLLDELARRDPQPVLSAVEAAWLRATASAVAERVEGTDWPLGIGLIHGDAWAGNLLWDGCRSILGDWDGVAIGPREVDLIPTWYAVLRFGRHRAWSCEFGAGPCRQVGGHIDRASRLVGVACGV